jgi:hypothetical protein
VKGREFQRFGISGLSFYPPGWDKWEATLQIAEKNFHRVSRDERFGPNHHAARHDAELACLHGQCHPGFAEAPAPEEEVVLLRIPE